MESNGSFNMKKNNSHTTHVDRRWSESLHISTLRPYVPNVWLPPLRAIAHSSMRVCQCTMWILIGIKWHNCNCKIKRSRAQFAKPKITLMITRYYKFHPWHWGMRLKWKLLDIADNLQDQRPDIGYIGQPEPPAMRQPFPETPLPWWQHVPCHVSAAGCDLWRVSAGFSNDLKGCPTPKGSFWQRGHSPPSTQMKQAIEAWLLGVLPLRGSRLLDPDNDLYFRNRMSRVNRLQTTYKYQGENIINSRTTFHHESFSCESAKKAMTRFHHSFFLSGPAWRGHAYGCQSHPTIAGTPCFFPLSPVHAQLAATLRLWSCQVATASTGPSATDCQIFPASSAQSRS